MLQWAHSYYLTHIWTHKNNINWNVSVHHLFTSPVASQHLPLSCVYSDFFYTHKHTIMLKCLQMTCKIFLLLQTNLLEICYMWKNHDSFFSSISHTHTPRRSPVWVSSRDKRWEPTHACQPTHVDVRGKSKLTRRQVCLLSDGLKSAHSALIHA